MDKAVISLSAKRLEKNPVRYTVHFNHDEQGFWIQAEGLTEDPESKRRLAYFLHKASDLIESGASAQASLENFGESLKVRYAEKHLMHCIAEDICALPPCEPNSLDCVRVRYADLVGVLRKHLVEVV